jgi:hypothetical protein
MQIHEIFHLTERAPAVKQPILRKGDRGPAVSQYQSSLSRVGFTPGKIDGIFGPRTEFSTMNLQRRHRLPVDGVAGPATYRIIDQLEQQLSRSSANTDVSAEQEKPIASVVDAGRGYTTIKTTDGEIHKRVGTRNWRNNNPGNIEFGRFAQSQGAVGTDGRFAVFPTLQQGLRAKEALLFNPRSPYHNLSVRDAIYRYAPPEENDTRLYLTQVLQATGADPDTPMSRLSSSQKNRLVSVISRIEGFKVGSIEPAGDGTGVA